MDERRKALQFPACTAIFTAVLAVSFVLGCGAPAGDASPGFDGPMVLDSGPDAGTNDTDAGDPSLDTDGDGLPDVWENAAGDPSVLDPMSNDTDGDGTPDGNEDPDGDGLTNLEEFAAGRLDTSPAGVGGPHPLQLSLLIELDWMNGRNIANANLRDAVDAYADLPLMGHPSGPPGIGLHIYRDEGGIAAFDFSGDLGQRQDFFENHPASFSDSADPPIPYDDMVHVIVVTRRTDISGRGGEVVTDGNGMIERSGVLIYHDALDALHPQCAAPGAMPPLPDITLEEALAGTLIHEIGHTLQLGHDTTVGGSINFWNVMSIPMSCMEAQSRFHGVGNTDPDLGATMNVFASRFSLAAAMLMTLTNKLSAETSELIDNGDGLEM